MFKFKPLQIILIWLSIIGKDNLTILHNQKSQFVPIFLHIFRFIYLVILITTLFYPFQDNIANDSMSLYAVNYLTFNIVIVNSVDIISSWLHANSISAIILEIEESLDALALHFIDLNSRIALFARDFRKKCFIAFLIFLIEFIIRHYHPSDIFKPFTYATLTFAILYKNVEIIYVTFYIDVQTFILLSLNENLSTVAIDCLNESFIYAVSECEEKLYILHRVQIIHLKVWKISENLNIRFGGFLLGVCAGTVIILIYAGTSSFDILMKSNNKLDVLSE